eukprot:365482-Chlamydomonas_euryale.AAC.10
MLLVSKGTQLTAHSCRSEHDRAPASPGAAAGASSARSRPLSAHVRGGAGEPAGGKADCPVTLVRGIRAPFPVQLAACASDPTGPGAGDVPGRPGWMTIEWCCAGGRRTLRFGSARSVHGQQARHAAKGRLGPSTVPRPCRAPLRPGARAPGSPA